MKNPIVTCGALIKKGKKILLLKRKKYPFKNYWSLPGGHLEFKETAIDCIKREVKEETNLDFSPRFYKYQDEIIPKINWHAIVLFFRGSFRGKLKPQKSEVKEIKWFSKSEIKNLKIAFYHKEIIKEFLKKS